MPKKNDGFDIKFMKQTTSQHTSSVHMIMGIILLLCIVVLVWWLGLEKAAKYTPHFYG